MAVLGGGARVVLDELLVDEEAQHVLVVVEAIVDGQDGPRVRVDVVFERLEGIAGTGPQSPQILVIDEHGSGRL